MRNLDGDRCTIVEKNIQNQENKQSWIVSTLKYRNDL
jgi:hypothetical protein